jgi:DNA-binding transcriptional LysR family regulator
MLPDPKTFIKYKICCDAYIKCIIALKARTPGEPQMRLTHRQLDYIREVAAKGSISEACKAFRISASSVLAAIATAEEEIGTRIFNRRAGHGVEVTPAGQRFLVSVRRFLAAGMEFERSTREFADRPVPELRLGCFSPLGALLIPPVLRRYIDAYGECNIVLQEGDQAELRTWLATGELDLVLTYDIGEDFSGAVTPICRFPAHALLRRDDPLALQPSVTMQELAERSLILLDLPETRTYLLTLFDFAARRPKIALRTRSYETVRAAVVSGLGVSILNMRPHHLASPDHESLIRVPIADPLRKPTLVAIDPYGDQKPAYVRSFIAMLFAHLHSLGPENFAVTDGRLKDDLLLKPPNSFGTMTETSV